MKIATFNVNGVKGRMPRLLDRPLIYDLTRMWLESRPPVTNLYSSALFVGWGAVALCLALEFFYRNAIGSVTAGASLATGVIAVVLPVAYRPSITLPSVRVASSLLASPRYWPGANEHAPRATRVATAAREMVRFTGWLRRC